MGTHAEGSYDEACYHFARSQRVEGTWWELDFVYCWLAPVEYTEGGGGTK